MANNRPVLPDIQTMIQMGINPKTGLPIKLGGLRCTTKEDIKRAIRIQDEKIAVNKYVWYNLPCNLTSQEVERMLYYKGQLAFFYMKDLDEFYFMPYALDGGLDFYGRYKKVHPVPMNSGSEDDKSRKGQAEYLAGIKLNCVYGIKLPGDLKEDDIYNSAVLLHDYTKQISQYVVPAQVLNEPVIDMEAECMPFLRTALLNATGTRAIRVQDADQQASVQEATRNMIDSALAAQPYVPVTGNMEFQELGDGTVGKAAEFLQAMQAIDNLRLGLHGVPNGGLFEKSQYLNNAQTEMNLGGADISLTFMDGLAIRQNFCNIVNSIWGLGIWCEPSETIVNMDMDGDGVAYDRNDDSANSSVEGESNNDRA